jgi:site-specific DNA recombinase
MGDYYFNVIDSKTATKRPPEEWIKTSIPAIIDAATFERVRAKRESRSPEKVAPRLIASPTLLTGLLKCGVCGGSLTLATGKSGRYKYYKCTSRQNKGNHACTSANLPMEKLDDLVLNQLADKVFTPDRLQAMMEALRQRMKSSKDTQQERANQINRQIKQTEERQQRLLDAIETGTIELDEITQRRAQQLKASREALIIELAEVRRDHSVPIETLKPSQIDGFAKALRHRLLSGDSGFAKSYLNLLVDEVVVEGKMATIQGSYAALAAVATAEKKMGTCDQVPTFMHDWCARRDSNSLPLGS